MDRDDLGTVSGFEGEAADWLRVGGGLSRQVKHEAEAATPEALTVLASI